MKIAIGTAALLGAAVLLWLLGRPQPPLPAAPPPLSETPRTEPGEIFDPVLPEDTAPPEPDEVRRQPVEAVLPLTDDELERLLARLDAATGPDFEAILEGLCEQPLNLERAADRLSVLLPPRDRTPAMMAALAAIYPRLLKSRGARTPEVARVLQEGLGHASIEVRMSATEGLASAPAVHGETLARAYDVEPEEKVRLRLVRSLGTSRDFLARVLTRDPSPWVRRVAAEQGRRCFGPEDREWLSGLRDGEPDPEVRLALDKTLTTIRDR